jgi:hypothetical protein
VQRQRTFWSLAKKKGPRKRTSPREKAKNFRLKPHLGELPLLFFVNDRLTKLRLALIVPPLKVAGHGLLIDGVKGK